MCGGTCKGLRGLGLVVLALAGSGKHGLGAATSTVCKPLACRVLDALREETLRLSGEGLAWQSIGASVFATVDSGTGAVPSLDAWTPWLRIGPWCWESLGWLLEIERGSSGGKALDLQARADDGAAASAVSGRGAWANS